MARGLQPRRVVLELLLVVGCVGFPAWLALTFAWWRRLAPPRIALARIYMALGAAWSAWHCVQLAVARHLHTADPIEGLLQQHLGALVVLAALYAEIFVRWLRVRSGALRLAPARIVFGSGRRRARVRLVAEP
ncbi:MAG: hypothetical protein KF773_26195 [Deltaproteobacteria bacterium]|nr:hypothetical protein [Deltaproteobacteria bacterium]MCW5802615.1 hypothetical protein [Deltaproteobacteria bacterium]